MAEGEMAEGHPGVIAQSLNNWRKGASPFGQAQQAPDSPLFLHSVGLTSPETYAISLFSPPPQSVLTQYALVPEEQEQGDL